MTYRPSKPEIMNSLPFVYSRGDGSGVRKTKDGECPEDTIRDVRVTRLLRFYSQI